MNRSQGQILVQWPQEPERGQMHSLLLDSTMIALVSLGIYLELAVCYCIYPCM